MPLRLWLLLLCYLLVPGIQAEAMDDDWDRLNEQVMQFFGSAKYAEALVPAQKALQLARQRHGAEHADVALALNNLAALHDSLGDYAKAEVFYKEALALKEKLLGPKDPDVALSLNNLAALRKTQARYAEAEPLYQRALGIWEEALGPSSPEVATALNNLALLYDTQGEAAKAEPLYRRSLAIREQSLGARHPAVALALNNLAALHFNQGELAKAEPLFLRALAIREEVLGPSHPDIALSLNNLAVLYRAQGDYARALPLYRRALAMDEALHGPYHPEIATDLNNLAVLYDSLGDAARALPLYERSLDILERAFGKEHPRVAEALNNLAMLHKTQGDHAKAAPLYERALAILEQTQGPEHPAVATALNNLGVLLDGQKEQARAETLLRRALAIREQAFGPGHLLVGISLNNLAELYRARGDTAQAQGLYLRAWWIGRQVGNPQFLADVLDNLSRFLAAQGKTQAAIFVGKEAVRGLQGLRGNVADLGKETLKGFDATIEDVYRHLARLLVQAGRLAEAELVLQLFKAQEQFEFQRRSTDTGLLSAHLPLSLLESEQQEALEAKGLEEDFYQAFAKTLAAFDVAGQRAQTSLLAEQDIQVGLRRLKEKEGEMLAALYSIADRDEYGLILVTADERRAFWVKLQPDELRRRVARFRALVQEPRSDVRPEGRALLDIILPPEAHKELERLGITSLLWHLDGPLRLLPLAALHDGQGYLIERYRLATFLALDLHRLFGSRDTGWTGLGFGVSKGREVEGEVFSDLPSVPKELSSVIQRPAKMGETQGAIAGDFYLDQAFDWPNFKRLLQQGPRHSLLHIASHFNLAPGNETQSFLLTGQGEPIKLALLNRQQRLFEGVDLLTLSACNTALSAGQDAQGREVDGLAHIAWRQGAASVLASLWPVADEATARLMAHFYSLLEGKKLGKAEALRQAQMEMLRTQADIKAEGKQGFAEDSAHPFFWAAFVLMGNWH